MVDKYVNNWISGITDITDTVSSLRDSKNNNTFDNKLLPIEKEYIVKDNIKNIIGITR